MNGMTNANSETFKQLYKEFIGRPLGVPGKDPNENSKQNLDTGTPYTHYENRTKEQLYHLAQELDIDGRSYMNKDDLVHAVRENKH